MLGTFLHYSTHVAKFKFKNAIQNSFITSDANWKFLYDSGSAMLAIDRLCAQILYKSYKIPGIMWYFIRFE